MSDRSIDVFPGEILHDKNITELCMEYIWLNTVVAKVQLNLNYFLTIVLQV